MDPNKLQEELLELLDQLRVQSDTVRHTAQSMGIETSALRDYHGEFVMLPILGAKAQVLHALVVLETEGDLNPGSAEEAQSNGAE